jgi:hypothetical protein
MTSASDDIILATINAGYARVDESRILARDTGSGLTVVWPTPGVLQSTSAGGVAVPDGNPLGGFFYQPPLEFSGIDSLSYQVVDALGGTASATIFFDVSNDAPSTPTYTYSNVAPGTVIPMADLVFSATDAEGDTIIFSEFFFDPSEINVVSDVMPGTTEPGPRVSPGSGKSIGTFRPFFSMRTVPSALPSAAI